MVSHFPMKKYKCIVKLHTPAGDHFLKYRTSDLLKFTKFLEEKHQGWKWFNVYDRISGQQLDWYSINKKPLTKHIIH